MNRFEQRRALVTGAASGIGRATALRLLDEGARLVAADISEDGLAETARLAERAGTAERLSTLRLDTGDEDSVVSVVDETVNRLGGLDVLVNSAGILRAAHTHEASLEMWNRIITVNLTGTFLVTRQALPALLDSPNGVVVNFSSTSASFAHPYMAAYAASKGGIQSFTHTLASEYSEQGLRAVCVAPGSIKSGITDATPGYLPSDADMSLFAKLSPMLATEQRAGGATMAGPETVAGVVAMLASEDGAFVTGTEIRIDGGTHA
ncbi:SDR family NAD(P)-dependent oxidoreductase [Actinopolyspora mortivallis]|uniref:Short-chain dehydrogenase n=1 Tax=Actinopolyspora mortivallis TaxID=33906 RepID=A0A2T0GW51_ACTMO|nr:SDR family oxidoreductase [Actinopolyspora mortivallis]PRW63340.1 short-chain dehydrogenase [Actinopolyspora mortivallis]